RGREDQRRAFVDHRAALSADRPSGTHAGRHVQNHGAAAEYPKTIAITAQQEWLTAWHLDVQRLELFGRRQTRWRQRLVARRRSSTRVSRSLGTHAASSHFMQLAACTMWST